MLREILDFARYYAVSVALGTGIVLGNVEQMGIHAGVYYYHYYQSLPSYEKLLRWHVSDHCGFPAHIDAWATCAARESDKFREQQIQLAVNAWPNL